MELLKKVGDHESFVFHNEQINHIEDLAAILKDATDEEYSKYASEDKNDFANWVEHVLNNKDVADKLRASLSKDDTVKLLESEIGSRKQESVLESKESILSQAPVERPEEMDIENPADSGFSEPKESITPSIPAPIVEEPTPVVATEPAPIVAEPAPVADEPAPIAAEPAPAVEEPVVESKEPVAPVADEPAPIVAEPAPAVEEPVVESKEPVAPIESSESIIPNVVTPINKEDSKEIKSDAEPHHFCGVHMDCMKREFVFGLLIGLLIGIIGLQMIHAVL